MNLSGREAASAHEEPRAPAAAPAPGGTRWPPTGSSRPYTRWWWLNGPFRDEDVEAQLRWIQAQGFGGVELAWLSPDWGEEFEIDRPAWLGAEWSRIVAHAKRTADALGLGCDFTLGSVWPFGGTCVARQDSSQTFDGPSGQMIRCTWEAPAKPPVLDHLNAAALGRYFDALGPAFAMALDGTPSALFCDSLEVEKSRLWSPGLWSVFEERCGYSLREHVARLHEDPGVLYDYKKVLGEAFLREFLVTYVERCHRAGALARVQCHGAPTDLLSAYAAVDVPESETLLFPPAFSRIAASAAALAGRPVVSCETFTAIYGFIHGATLMAAFRSRKKELTADLRLLADAVFANGVNQIVWHGTPYNPPGGTNEFFASVHVGPDSQFAPDLPAFNAYLQRVSELMRSGRPFARLAVYLPNEDMMLAGDPAEEAQTPGECDSWEMRRVGLPAGAEGFAPIWISGPFLAAGAVRERCLVAGPITVPALALDVEWLDGESLTQILRLARDGLPAAVLRRPRQPGRVRDPGYEVRLDELLGLANVVRRVADLPVRPLVEGDDLPWFWARECGSDVLLFFAHPAARRISYPMARGMAEATLREERRVRIHACEATHDVVLDFAPGRSIALRVSAAGARAEPLPPAG